MPNWHYFTLFSLLMACSSPQPRPLTLTTLNDFHGALYELPTRDKEVVAGGLPWLAGLLDVWRGEGKPMLLLDGGDIFQGSWTVNASEGMAAVEAYNLLQVDAAAVGNHEFDYGGLEGKHPLRGALERAGEAAEWKWLSANIYDAKNNTPWTPKGFAPSTILEKGGVKIGVIGLSTTDTPETTLKKNVADLNFVDVVPVVKHLSEALRHNGVDLIAVVGHLSGACPKGTKPTEVCEPDGEIGRLLTELSPGTIDVLVTGHSHSQMAFRHRDTIVLQSGSKGRWVGRVDLSVGQEGIEWSNTTIWAPVAVNHRPSVPGCDGGRFDATPQMIDKWRVTPHAKAIAMIEKWEQKTGNLCSPAGCTTEPLPRNRTGASVLGSIVADAMVTAFPQADLTVTNAGGLRANLPKGALIRGDIQGVMPFDNRIVLVEMTGERLEALFEIGTSGVHGPLQISGGTLRLSNATAEPRDLNSDGQKEEWETDRVCSSEIKGQPIVANQRYRIATTDFLLGGGDHLGFAFEGASLLETGPLLRDHLVDWFKGHADCVSPPANGLLRVTAHHCDPKQETAQ